MPRKHELWDYYSAKINEKNESGYSSNNCGFFYKGRKDYKTWFYHL